MQFFFLLINIKKIYNNNRIQQQKMFKNNNSCPMRIKPIKINKLLDPELLIFPVIHLSGTIKS